MEKKKHEKRDEELEALGKYFDEHGDDVSEWDEAFSPSDFGCSDVVEAALRHSAKKKSSGASFRQSSPAVAARAM